MILKYASIPTVTAALLSAFPATAQTTAQLMDTLKMREVLQVMRDEGMRYSTNLEADLFPTQGGQGWQQDVQRIYDIDRLVASFGAAFEAEMPEAHIPAANAFFESETGQKIIGLEISARVAQMDEAIEEASIETLEAMIAAEDERLDLLRAFSDANQLVESNVVGSMNANYAFYIGLVDGGAFSFDLTEDEILADVWNQEAEIRANTEEWLFAYLALAYQPLEDAEVQSYIDFSYTEAGKALNQALFEGFDTMLVDVSRALGLASARYMAGQDI